jgi:hypothetical protein
VAATKKWKKMDLFNKWMIDQNIKSSSQWYWKF